MARQMSGICRIGCGSGFWGDSPEGARQLVAEGVDFLVFDYLAETTMAILAGNRRRDAKAGFVPDFVEYVFVPHARAIEEKKIRIVSNAGGMNVEGCREAVEKALKAAGVSLKIATVTGDDLMPQAERYASLGLPEKLMSLNAYLGAAEIAHALDAGADIVITGRCVDSALVLGPLVHTFGWSWNDHDRLSQGSLAGHLLECGSQVTGGILTDWEKSTGWDHMGLPIAECRHDGSFVVTKPKGTGGLVNRATVCEQMVYEVGDPGSYTLPDVICDWRNVEIDDIGDDRVRVAHARGRRPTKFLKVSAVSQDGFRTSGEITIAGRDAAGKARKTADAVLARTRRLMHGQGFSDYDETSIEVLGAEAFFGAHGSAPGSREVVLKVAVRHQSARALDFFAREFLTSATSMAQGITGFAAGRPKVRAVLRHQGVFLDRSLVSTDIAVDGEDIGPPKTARDFVDHDTDESTGAEMHMDAAVLASASEMVPLIALAYGRSGDKGDDANIGVIARHPDYLPFIRAAVNEVSVKEWFAHFAEGDVHRFEWPALPGFNFVLEKSLGGGGTASLRKDPQGKTYAQLLMEFPVRVPPALKKTVSEDAQ
jgi:hypothetical protein